MDFEHRISAVVSDLDGTLLNPDGSLPFGYDTLHRALRERGMHLVVASARPYGNIAKLFANVAAPSGIVACDGAIARAFREGATIYTAEEFLPREHARPLFEALIDAGVEPVLFLSSVQHFLVVASKYDVELIENLQRSDSSRPLVVAARQDAMTLLEDSDVRSLAAFGERDLVHAAARSVAASASALGGVRVYSYDETRFGGGSYAWLDCVSTRTRKEDAIVNVLDALGVSERQVLACGNGKNDAGMLLRARLAFCPTTAIPEIKAICGSAAPVGEGDDFAAWLLERLDSLCPEL